MVAQAHFHTSGKQPQPLVLAGFSRPARLARMSGAHLIANAEDSHLSLSALIWYYFPASL